MQRITLRLTTLLILLAILATWSACSRAEATNPTPYEFTLILATNNNGEVGPCG